LPEEDLAVTERFLRYLYDMGRGPLMKALHKAPEEDE